MDKHNQLSKVEKIVSLVDIMHGIQEQTSLVYSIKENVVKGIIPLSIILM
jgi:hypothetical protein